MIIGLMKLCKNSIVRNYDSIQETDGNNKITDMSEDEIDDLEFDEINDIWDEMDEEDRF